jgi:phosphate starvation-inducible PhoH-like protein
MRKVLLSDRSLQLLFGPLDENAKFLENLFDVTIQTRDGGLTIDGEEKDVAALERILLDFSALADRGHAITNGDLKSAFRQIAENAALSLHDFFPKMQLLTGGKRQVTPKSPNQRRYIERSGATTSSSAAGGGGRGRRSWRSPWPLPA